jgi:thymidylate synthase
MISPDLVWKHGLIDLKDGNEVKPRGMTVRELIGYQYTIDMNNPILSLPSRKMNYAFMFGEAAWICSGSNWLDDLTPYMKRYKDFSDDGVFLNGAYGVKVIEQVAYVADTLQRDPDSRQAIINIWRERPAASKDIPCTVNMQFFIRDGIQMVVNMRSQDAVLGFSYDIFTFSAVANLLRTLLLQRGIKVELSTLTVNVGSFHIYERHFNDVEAWLDDASYDPKYPQVITDWAVATREPMTAKEYVNYLKDTADDHLRGA